MKPYRKMRREIFDGALNIDQSINLNEDYYTFTYMHWLKRRVVYDDDVESEDENENSKERWFCPTRNEDGDKKEGSKVEADDKEEDKKK